MERCGVNMWRVLLVLLGTVGVLAVSGGCKNRLDASHEQAKSGVALSTTAEEASPGIGGGAPMAKKPTKR